MLEKEANGAKKIVAMLLGQIEYEQKKSGKPGSKYELYPFFRYTSIMERVFTEYYNM